MLNDREHAEAASLIRRLLDLSEGRHEQYVEVQVVVDAQRWLREHDAGDSMENGPVCGSAAAVSHFDGGLAAVLRSLAFRPERSRPVFRNRHTGREVVVEDLAVNDHGGFQGGCRQHIVITNEEPPPGLPAPTLRDRRGVRGHNVHGLWAWVEHWEPTGRYVPWTQEPREDPVQVWRRRALDAEHRLTAMRDALGVGGGPS
jgi:hypothetical protein